ncbi:hypothetical protein [Nocardia sp. NPDC050435]|uniref:hypothetical protein n=1 Tax=Nocardia sp. NPDC050435 TaxID=3155040 RepID=UPI0033DA2EE3
MSAPTAPAPTMKLIPENPITRIRVLVGEGPGTPRRGDKALYAMSDCRFECPTAEIAERTVAALAESDEKLRNRPEELMLWDWANTYWEADPDNPHGGGTVILGVAWYDQAFYQERREATFGTMHKRIYERIGLPVEGISVTHYLVDAS